MNESAHAEFPRVEQRLPDAALEAIGVLRTRSSEEIESSRFNIGYECLDRKMWFPEKALPHLVTLGAKRARVQTGWSRCETENGQYDFAWLDEIVDTLLSHGIQPWFNVSYGNMLYTDAPAADAVGWAPIYSQTARDGWTSFLQALVRHFRDRVRHYEIWNEPDLAVFWKPHPPSPAGYTDLVKLSVAAIRAEQPEAL